MFTRINKNGIISLVENWKGRTYTPYRCVRNFSEKFIKSSSVFDKICFAHVELKGGNNMAIYHFSGQVISRSKQGKIRSAISCAAYRSGEKLFDERYNSEKIYYRKVKPVSTILLPRNAPAWAGNREKLWNAVERKEKQYNAQLAREFNIALPIELTEKEQEKLAFDFCQKAFVDRGMVADISIHRDDKNNPHFHVMLTMRPLMKRVNLQRSQEKNMC